MEAGRELTEQDALGLSSGQRIALVERVAAGRTLQRSARLRDLLLYVGRQTILQSGAQLRETDIGATVFGRSPQYDTSQDNIVRVNFTELRKRIQQHFREEGRDEPVIFLIPRGTYGIRFYERKADAFDRVLDGLGAAEAERPAVPVDLDAEDPPEPVFPSAIASPAAAAPAAVNGQPKVVLVMLYALAALAVLFAVLAGYFFKRSRDLGQQLAPWSATPALQAFWQPFFAGREPVDLVLADTSIALAQDITLKQIPLNDYISNEHHGMSPAAGTTEKDHQQATRDLDLILSRNTGSVGDFRVAAEIRDLAPPRASRLYFAREYSPALVRQHNAVLLGSRKSNPWVELFEDQLQYHLSTSEDRRETFVTVVHPAGQEQSQYAAFSDPSTRAGYCVVALLPNPGGTGTTLLIAGTDSQATEAAGDFITSERSLQELIHQTGTSNLSRLQLLMRTERMRGTPMSARVVSFRTGL